MNSKLFKLLTPARRVLVGSVLSAMSITLTAPYATAAEQCASIFAKPAALIPTANLVDQLNQNYESWNIEALRALQNLTQQVPSLAESAGGQRLLKGLDEVLKDERLASFHQLIRNAATRALQSKRAQNPNVDGRDLLISSLKQEMTTLLGKEVAEARIAELKGREEITKEAMQHALGELTLEESRINLIGKKGIREISPDSVIGRYLSQAAAKGIDAQTFVGTFYTGPQSRTRGTERLFVSVDATTAPLIEKMIGKDPHFLLHNHTPGQGTLYLHHNGQGISYAKYNGQSTIAGGGAYVNTMAPVIPLSTVEASNAMNFFELGRLTRSARTKYPSSLVDMTSGKPKLYMRPGAYTCCSHWFGEMALGEKTVKTYSVPGQADQHGYNRDPLAKDQSAVRTAPVGSYTHFSQHGEFNVIGTETRTDRLTRLVWHEKQGSEQMWSMLKAPKQLQKAELTNPGYILYTLTATADAARVPVVLIYRNNAAEPLNQTVIDSLRNDNNIPHY